MVAVKITCQGKVQGVFFRATAQKIAIQLSLKGWVRNELNGDVCMEAYGNDDQLNQLIAWCYRGSELSKVENVIVEYVRFPDLIPNDFSIHR